LVVVGARLARTLGMSRLPTQGMISLEADLTISLMASVAWV